MVRNIFAVDRLPQLTIALIVLSAVVTLGSGFGNQFDMIRPFLISEYRGTALPEVRHGELWRLFTPMFIHLGVLHLLFNMLWLWDLGGSIERLQGWFTLLALTLVIGALSNLAQYYWAGPVFGGMSGVVYGLLGYVWMQGQFNPRSGLFLHKEIVVMMLIWFALGWTGLIGHIANMAHTGGLVLGGVTGYTAAWLQTQRRR